MLLKITFNIPWAPLHLRLIKHSCVQHYTRAYVHSTGQLLLGGMHTSYMNKILAHVNMICINFAINTQPHLLFQE